MKQEGRKVGLITGAADGIGAAFARELAAAGNDVILVDRQEEKLASIAGELRGDYGLPVETVLADLSESSGVCAVERRIEGTGLLQVLVNSAGFGAVGPFAESDLRVQLGLLDVHVVAAVRLCRAALPGMIERGEGTVINVSSLGAFLPIPESAMYCAVKACLNTFTEALHQELLGTGVRVQVLCPGPTQTSFYENSNIPEDQRPYVPRSMQMSAREVARKSLRALSKGKVIYAPGPAGQLFVFLARNKLGAAFLRAWQGRRLASRRRRNATSSSSIRGGL